MDACKNNRSLPGTVHIEKATGHALTHRLEDQAPAAQEHGYRCRITPVVLLVSVCLTLTSFAQEQASDAGPTPRAEAAPTQSVPIAPLTAPDTAPVTVPVVPPAPSSEPAAPSQLPFAIPRLDPNAPTGPSTPPRMAGLPPTAGGYAPAAGAPRSPIAGGQGGAVYEDIRDIRGPIAIPPPAGRVWIPIAAALLAMAVLATAWHWYRARKHVRAKRAFEIAFGRLQKARALMQPEEARAFSYLVSETVRTYIDKRFGLGATHCTTPEFIRELVESESNPLQDHRDRLRDFLRHCDLAKFGRWSLTVPQMEGMHTSAWHFVEATKPQPEEKKKRKKKRERARRAVQSPVNQVDVAGLTPALATGGAS